MSENELVAFIKSEKERYERSARMTWLFGGLLVLVVGGYLFWISSFLSNELLDSEDLATIIATNIEQEIPVYLEQTTDTLVARAPEVAQTVSKEIKQAIPEVRGDIEKRIDDVYLSIGALEIEIEQTVKAYIQEHAEEIKLFADAHTEEEFANYFAGELLTEVTRKLDHRLKVNSGGSGLKDYHHDTLHSLEELDNELGVLLAQSRHRMTRSDHLKRRLVVSLYHLFSQSLTGDKVGM